MKAVDGYSLVFFAAMFIFAFAQVSASAKPLLLQIANRARVWRG